MMQDLSWSSGVCRTGLYSGEVNPQGQPQGFGTYRYTYSSPPSQRIALYFRFLAQPEGISAKIQQILSQISSEEVPSGRMGPLEADLTLQPLTTRNNFYGEN
jgi:hypothetical protein